MTDPVPLRDAESGPAARAGAAVEAFRRDHEWPLDRRAAVYWKIRNQTTGGGIRRLAPHLAVAAACCACAVAGLWLTLETAPTTGPSQAAVATASGAPAATASGPMAMPLVMTDWSRLDLGDVGLVEVSSADSFELRELPPERQLRVRSGVLRAQVVHQDPARPVVVVTPQLRVVVVGTRFDIHAADSRSTVEVFEGRVRVETDSGSVMLGAGESITSDDPRLSPAPVPAVARPSAPAAARRAALPPAPIAEPPAPPAAAVTVHDCSRRASLGDQESCLLDLAQGTNLAAQDALFSLALLARDRLNSPAQALQYFRTYEERFPAGVLAPEVALRSLELLKKQGLIDEAVEQAASFERRFASDPRAADVALLRAELLCGRPEGASAAESILETLSKRPQADIRNGAARLRARCRAAAREDELPETFAWPED